MSDDPAVLMYEHQPRLKHHPDSPNSWCGNCGQSWPCQTYRLAERVIAAEVKVARHEEPYRVQPPASSLRPMSSQAEPDWSNGVHP